VAAKYTHECDRCGQRADLERVGRFRDSDYHELLQDYFELEQEYIALDRKNAVLLSLERARLAAAHERINQMRELLNMLPDPVPEVEFATDDQENPFP
jgi:hypothetical protein